MRKRRNSVFSAVLFSIALMVNPVVVCAGEMDGVQDENVQIEER
ncbi:MAG: hypothetical protein V8S08_08715 [Lachnoclostridium sp.]